MISYHRVDLVVSVCDLQRDCGLSGTQCTTPRADTNLFPFGRTMNASQRSLEGLVSRPWFRVLSMIAVYECGRYLLGSTLPWLSTQLLIRQHDSRSRQSPPRQRKRGRSRDAERPGAMSVLKEVCSIHGTLGIDVGGTLAKCVMAEPHDASSTLPAEFGHPGAGRSTGRMHADLALTICRRRAGVEPILRRSVSTVSLDSSDPESESSRSGIEPMSCTIQFMSGSSAALEEALQSTSQKNLDEPMRGRPRRIAATGGGAHKLRENARAMFNVELVPVQEHPPRLEL